MNNQFSSVKFDNLTNEFPVKALSEQTLKSLSIMNIETMTTIQHRVLPSMLSGRDILASAKTGSGKTLAFIIPIVELLRNIGFQYKSGIGSIIISPTRELAMQTYDVAKEMCNNGHNITVGLAVGGTNRKTESFKIKKGVNILIATPGRLLDHLYHGKEYTSLKNFKILIIDEADLILQQGFETEINSILKILPKSRQTALFSATQTKKVSDLCRVSLSEPQIVGIDLDLNKMNKLDKRKRENETEEEEINEEKERETVTVETLEQGFVLVEPQDRFRLLFTFLKRYILTKKVMVFMSSCNSVQFQSDVLNFVDVKTLAIHGHMKQAKRTSVMAEFRKMDNGGLICTDVAARGLDIPEVDWIIQVDAPHDTDQQIHRVGRTARGEKAEGKALLFLMTHEVDYIKLLNNRGIPMTEQDFSSNKLAVIDNAFFKLINKHYWLQKSAKEAQKSSLSSYASHTNKKIFNIHEMDIKGQGKSYGFEIPPQIDLTAFKLNGPSTKSLRNKRKILVEEGVIGKKHLKLKQNKFTDK